MSGIADRTMVSTYKTQVSQDRRRQLVQLALQRFGREQLARRLDVPSHWIDRWAEGLLSLPDRKAQALVDLLNEARQKRKT